ncbi:hypothetical protein GC197_13400 [bacterium]|nr:hypothetical protein [bacterium]
MIWAIVIVMGCVSAGLNFWWFEKLQIHAKAHPLPTKFSIALWEVLTFVGLLGLIMLPTVYRAQANQAIYRENVAVADAPFAVPDRAEAICYQRSRTGLILASYEISETDFKSWLSEHDSELRKGGGWSNDFQMPVDVDLPDAGLRPFRSRPRDHSVTDGIIVRWSLGKVDFTITFDRIEGIAFYEEREIRK